MLTYDQSLPSSLRRPIRSVISPVNMASPRSFRSSSKPRHKHMWIVSGPAGCGKTTVAKFLAGHYNFKFIEGDEFHPPANVQKMSNGIPLNDEDRWDWLIQLREEAVNALDDGVSGVVLTCSALKRKYRDVIRVARLNDHHVYTHFIYLRASEDLLLARVKARKDHYMKDSMVKSQMESLEEPKEKELDVLSIDVSGSKSEVQKLALDAVQKVMAQDFSDN